MDRRSVDRYTSPAIGAAIVLGSIAIALQPDLALPVLAAAEVCAGIGCAGFVRTSLRLAPPAAGAAVVFAAKALFWLGMAALSIYWYAGQGA